MVEFKIPSLSHIVYSTTLEIRVYDVNYGNHLGNDSLVSLLHEARVQFLKHFGYTEVNIEGVGILVTKLAVVYLAEGSYGDKIIFNIAIGDHNATSVELIYQAIAPSGKELARALTVITFYDYNERVVVPVPEKFLALAGN